MGLEWEKTIYQLVQDFFHRTTILETSGNILSEIMTTPPNNTEQDARRVPMYHVSKKKQCFEVC